MHKLIFMVLLGLVAYAAAACDNCDKDTQCCLRRMSVLREERCGNRGRKGDPCSDPLPEGEKYNLYCQCLEGLECQQTGSGLIQSRTCQEEPTTTPTPTRPADPTTAVVPPTTPVTDPPAVDK